MDRVRYLIGVLTLVVAAAGGVYLFKLLSDEDKSLYFRLGLEFHNVEGLLPGADVKYRGVNVGSVRGVTLRDDGRKGVAALALNPGTEKLACTNSKFWIVTPRFGGLAGGASGLETLVRDAYISFVTPDPAGPQLANGSSVAGWERPYVDPAEETMPPPRRGDLQMSLIVPENHGLGAGSEIKFRGVQTGEVTRIALASDGDHVRVELRIDRRYRSTVTDRSVFWVARPRLSGGIMGGMSLDDVSALLSPFIGYHTAPDEGQPVADGYLVAAETERPAISLEKVSVQGLSSSVASPRPRAQQSLQLVKVIYEAVEDDWFSPDDEIRREGTGVLFEDAEGRFLVMTARSACDASYFDRDTFGAEPDIRSEGVTVVLVDGSVIRAMRMWAASDGSDLALLTLEPSPSQREGLLSTAANLFAFDDGASGGGGTVWSLDAERQAVGAPVPSGEDTAVDGGLRGGPVMRGDRIVGVYGQSSGTGDTSAVASTSLLPESLRPRP